MISHWEKFIEHVSKLWNRKCQPKFQPRFCGNVLPFFPRVLLSWSKFVPTFGVHGAMWRKLSWFAGATTNRRNSIWHLASHRTANFWTPQTPTTVFTWDEKVILMKKNVPCLALWSFGMFWWWEWPHKISKSGHWGILRKLHFPIFAYFHSAPPNLAVFACLRPVLYHQKWL